MGKHRSDEIIGECALCLKNDTLKESHVMPKFFFRSLKKLVLLIICENLLYLIKELKRG